jgi:CP family cyanate transporter-like MFS transporter
MLGGVNAAYFTTNHFLPDYLTQSGRGELVADALIALNTGQLPGSLVLLALAGRLERRPAAYVAFGAITFAAVIGIVFGDGATIVLSAGMIGFATASALILLLALPPLISGQEDVPRMAAGMFTISYSCAVLVPVMSGFAWDITGAPALAFAPIGLGALVIIILSPIVRANNARQVSIIS